MTAEQGIPATAPLNSGWKVTFAGTGINLALGILYTWSMFKGAIEKEFGWMNYGVLFTAWGVGGLVLPRIQQMLTVKSGGSYLSSFITAGVLLVVGAVLTLLVKSRAKELA